MIQDEHEMLIEYSEMTSFDFNSKEFKEVRQDYEYCKNFVGSVIWNVGKFFGRLNFAKNY